MSYALMVLAVFWVNRTFRLYVAAPSWAFEAVMFLTAIGAGVLWGSASLWYVAFPVAGATTLLFHFDDFLVTKADEALASLLQRRR